MKKQKNYPQNKYFPIFTALFAIALAAAAISLAITHHQSQQIKQLQEQVIAQRIAGTINEDLNRLTPAPNDGKRYIPELRMVLPASTGDLIGPVAYRLFTTLKGDTNDLQLVSMHDLWVAESSLTTIQTKDISDVFEAVPRAQACGRGISIQFANGGRTPAFTKKLQDGRTIYMFTETGCKNDALFDLAKQLQSY